MQLPTRARYNTTFGLRNDVQGEVFGFLGERVGFHLPTTLQVPSVGGAPSLFELTVYGVHPQKKY